MSYCLTTRIDNPSFCARLAMSTPPGITRSAVANVNASGLYTSDCPVAVDAVPAKVMTAESAGRATMFWNAPVLVMLGENDQVEAPDVVTAVNTNCCNVVVAALVSGWQR